MVTGKRKRQDEIMADHVGISYSDLVDGRALLRCQAESHTLIKPKVFLSSCRLSATFFPGGESAPISRAFWKSSLRGQTNDNPNP
jgi:hypothetical protein